ncbi:hypothetical protein [Nocardia rhamnosiphila]|nr:hypothetical protein [Nocardia rhamnosiphila]
MRTVSVVWDPSGMRSSLSRRGTGGVGGLFVDERDRILLVEPP